MGLRQRARYKFDNLMARGVGAQILLLALFTMVIAVGYRLAKDARDPDAAYGVRVNPPKRETVAFTASDHVIVLAEG